MNREQSTAELQELFAALRADLLREGGPQISTTRNYNFAILPYDPAEEFAARREVSDLTEELRRSGWVTATISLNALLLKRLRAEGEDELEAIISQEQELHSASASRSLRALKDDVTQIVGGAAGLAGDIVEEVRKLHEAYPQERERMVIFLARAGALYPFLRTSALLKHVADHTHNLPVVLLYPGTVVGDTGLSFMGQATPDRDYRPRIYR